MIPPATYELLVVSCRASGQISSHGLENHIEQYVCCYVLNKSTLWMNVWHEYESIRSDHSSLNMFTLISYQKIKRKPTTL